MQTQTTIEPASSFLLLKELNRILNTARELHGLGASITLTVDGVPQKDIDFMNGHGSMQYACFENPGIKLKFESVDAMPF